MEAEILHTIQARFNHQIPGGTFNMLCSYLALLITSVNMAHFKIHFIDNFPACYQCGQT